MNQNEIETKRGKQILKRGVGLLVVLMFVAGGGIWIVKGPFIHRQASNTSHVDQPTIAQITDAEISPPPQPEAPIEAETARPEISTTEVPAVEPEIKPEAAHQALVLTETELPVLVVTTEPFTLLNNTGKETSIPIGTKIAITNRSKGGTLTTKIGGSLFVGNESRLLGKIKSLNQ